MGVSNFWRSLTRGTRFQVLFYGGAGIIGTICFVGPALFTLEKFQPVLVGLGIAFLSSSVLGFAHRLFFYDDFRSEMTGLVEQSLGNHLSSHMFPFIDEGFERLYRDRRSAIRQFSTYIQHETDRAIIIGSSLRGLLDPTEDHKEKKDFADLIRQKVEDSVPVRFLLTHPAVAFLREDAEGRAQGDIKREIIEALHYLAEELKVPMEDIRLYHGTPTLFSIIVSDRILVNPYTYQANAFENFCFEVARKGDRNLYSKILASHYERPWENERTRTKLTSEVLDGIEHVTLKDLFPQHFTA